MTADMLTNAYAVYQDFMNLYKKYTAKPYCFLVLDTILRSDNPLGFRKNLLETI